MKLKFTDSKAEYTSISYDLTERVFFIEDVITEDVIICSPVINVIAEYNPLDFQLYFLHNDRKNCTENCIFQVCVKGNKKEDQRIGWIFPLQALVSDSHDYACNPFFLKYAYVAYYLLLNGIDSRDEHNIVDEIELTDYYDDSLHILLIDQDNTKKISDFDLNDYVVSLFYNGYSYEGHGNLVSDIAYDKKKLNLKKIAVLLRDNKIISELFKTSIARNYNAEFSRFYAYYQIIEICISVVFDIEFKHLITLVNEKTSDLFEERDHLVDLVNEKSRVKKLLGSYSTVTGSLSNAFDEKLKEFLAKYERNPGNTLAENLYITRCMLVHELYKISPITDVVLKELNDYFLDALCEMIFTFHNPYE